MDLDDGAFVGEARSFLPAVTIFWKPGGRAFGKIPCLGASMEHSRENAARFVCGGSRHSGGNGARKIPRASPGSKLFT